MKGTSLMCLYALLNRVHGSGIEPQPVFFGSVPNYTHHLGFHQPNGNIQQVIYEPFIPVVYNRGNMMPYYNPQDQPTSFQPNYTSFSPSFPHQNGYITNKGESFTKGQILSDGNPSSENSFVALTHRQTFLYGANCLEAYKQREGLEKEITESMINRIKKQKIHGFAWGGREIILFNNYTYTDDESLIKEICAWDIPRCCQNRFLFTLADVHVLLMKLESFLMAPPSTLQALNYMYADIRNSSSGIYDVLYSICILRSVEHDKLMMFPLFLQNTNLDNLDETQFMNLFKILASIVFKDQTQRFAYILNVLFQSLDFNRNFKLSPDSVSIIIRTVLNMNSWAYTRLLLVESIRRAVTAETQLYDASYSHSGCFDDNNGNFRMFYLFFTFGIKKNENDGSIQKFEELNKAFAKKAEELSESNSIVKAAHLFSKEKLTDVQDNAREDLPVDTNEVNPNLFSSRDNKEFFLTCPGETLFQFYEEISSEVWCIENLIKALKKHWKNSDAIDKKTRWLIGYITNDAECNFAMFLKLFEASMGEGNVLTPILVLLHGHRFMEIKENQRKAIETVKKCSTSTYTYLPYIGDALSEEQGVVESMSIEEFVAAVDGVLLSIRGKEHFELHSYILRAFVYETRYFKNNIAKFMGEIMQIKGLSFVTKKGVLSRLINERYYGDSINRCLDQIITSVSLGNLPKEKVSLGDRITLNITYNIETDYECVRMAFHLLPFYY